MENRQTLAVIVIVSETVDIMWEAKRLLELLRDDNRMCAGTRLQVQIELRQTLDRALEELTKITDGRV